MDKDILEKLRDINSIASIGERYATLRKFYNEHQNLGMVGVNYAELLSRFSDDFYLKHAITVCERVIQNKGSRYVGDARLVIYQIRKKLSRKLNYTSLYDELSSIQQIYGQQNVRLEKRIRYEMILLIDELFRKKDYPDKGTLGGLIKQYDTLLKDCDPNEHVIRNDVWNSYITLLIHLKDYEKAAEVMSYMQENHYDLIADFERVNFYIQYHLGKVPVNNEKNRSYYEKQILNYDEDLAILHITRHVRDKNLKDLDVQTFDEHIDINTLFPYIKSVIQNRKPDSTRTVTDIYHVSMNEAIGHFGKQPATVVEVITEAGTKNIHTMYPVILCNNGLYKRREEALIRTNIKHVNWRKK